MNVLLLGVGMQGKAALHDLVHSQSVEQVIAADLDLTSLQTFVRDRQYGSQVTCEQVDAMDRRSIDRLMAQGPDVVVDLLPAKYVENVVASALEHRVHLVNTYYAGDEIHQLADEAEARSITILPELGMDPGIDLVLLGAAVGHFGHVESILSYGTGLPELEAADNPLHYKESWTFDGVLKAYLRPGRILQAGKIVEIDGADIFSPENIHERDIAGLGRLEAYPNGDALRYADMLTLKRSNLQNVGRYAMRWPGHCAFWKKMVDLHLLDDKPVMVDGHSVDRKHFLAAAIAPHIQYGPMERDLVLVRVEVTGWRNGKKARAIYQVLDFRDLETGLTAMSRTVGFTASIGAQMIGSGQLTKRGLLSPLTDIPFDSFFMELRQRGIQISSSWYEEEQPEALVQK